MVQIIRRNKKPGSYYRYKLYIPHGSDNTVELPDINLRLGHLYIPHGSDNT